MNLQHSLRTMLLATLLLAALPLAQAAETDAPLPESSESASGAGDVAFLSRLAQIQEQNGELDEAKSNYAHVIELIETEEGPYSARLIEPLKGLGRVELDQGQYEEAEEALRRSQHLSHRAEGVHTLSQLEVISLMTRLHMERDEPMEADREQRFALYLGERLYGEEEPELLPALYDLANWFMETGQFARARRLYERATEIIESRFGEKDQRLIKPWRLIAYARQLQGSSRCYATLEQAVALMQEQTDVAPQELAELEAELGDAYAFSRRRDDANTMYKEAFETLQQLPDGAARSALFTEPVQIPMSRLIRNLPQGVRTYTLYDDLSGRYASAVDPALNRGVRRLSDDEIKLSRERPPQVFIVTRGDPLYSQQISDFNEQTGDELQTRELVGRPLRFLLDQVLFVLPGEYNDPEKLHELFVTLEFSVDAEGRAHDVEEVEGNAPAKLVRIVIDALRRSYFRPRLEDGLPVATDAVKLTQWFY